MESVMMTRNDFYSTIGIEPTANDYTPVSVGKRLNTGNTKGIFADYLRSVTFTDAQTLREQTPETVHPERMFYIKDGQPVSVKNRILIVGDETEGQYAIHSNLYKIVQHKVIVDALASAMENQGIAMIGNTRTDKGMFNALALYCNPDMHIKPSHSFESSIALGVNVINSHDGNRGFGIRFFGVRGMCSNGMLFSETLGKYYSKHLTTVEELADNFGLFLTTAMDKVELLADRFHNLRQRMLSVEQQDALLLGVGLPVANVDLMTHFRDQLNPEIAGQKEISAYDLYNVATAYISYRTSGANTFNTTMSLFEDVEQMMVQPLDRLMDKGFYLRRKIIEAQEQAMATA